MIDPHERLPTGIDWSKPAPDPRALSHLQPGWDEIPERFQKLGMRLEPVPERRRARCKKKATTKNGKGFPSWRSAIKACNHKANVPALAQSGGGKSPTKESNS